MCNKRWFDMENGSVRIEILCGKCGHIFEKEITVHGEEVKMHSLLKKKK